MSVAWLAVAVTEGVTDRSRRRTSTRFSMLTRTLLLTQASRTAVGDLPDKSRTCMHAYMGGEVGARWAGGDTGSARAFTRGSTGRDTTASTRAAYTFTHLLENHVVRPVSLEAQEASRVGDAFAVNRADPGFALIRKRDALIHIEKW